MSYQNNLSQEDLVLRRKEVAHWYRLGYSSQQISEKMEISMGAVSRDIAILRSRYHDDFEPVRVTKKRIARHPEGNCRIGKCAYCYPSPGVVRIHAEVVLTINVEELAEKFGMREYTLMDGKLWAQEDIESLLRGLSYSEHITGLHVIVHGLKE